MALLQEVSHRKSTINSAVFTWSNLDITESVRQNCDLFYIFNYSICILLLTKIHLTRGRMMRCSIFMWFGPWFISRIYGNRKKWHLAIQSTIQTYRLCKCTFEGVIVPPEHNNLRWRDVACDISLFACSTLLTFLWGTNIIIIAYRRTSRWIPIKSFRHLGWLNLANTNPTKIKCQQFDLQPQK